ncbi:MAG: Crp/Fnr family transcriptional regulator [Acidobacteria bacterium]|jgi:CRP/FNR family transcriptional regulator, cyclic AMP receptor protein|nr:Crp/Fnr family transcriptional regulator [Acidobacteriota bacterium]
MSDRAAELLSRIDLFSELTAEELAAVAQVAQVHKLPRDTVVFDTGDAADAVYVVASGKVNIVVTSSEGKELILAVLGAGQVFGEMGLLDSSPRSAAVTTATAVELLVINRDEFHRMLDTQPQISRKLLTMLAQRLRRANAKMESLAYMDVAGRLARYFLDLARDHGQALGNGWLVVRRPTHSDIAHSIGTSRETVSRLINDFEDRLGMVNKGRFTYIREEMVR